MIDSEIQSLDDEYSIKSNYEIENGFAMSGALESTLYDMNNYEWMNDCLI